MQKDFQKVLYESLLYGFGKALNTHLSEEQRSILLPIIGREILGYLGKNGYSYDTYGTPDDIQQLIGMFVENGFVERLAIDEADRGHHFTWTNLIGHDAYAALDGEVDNPFLACPLNSCALYLADRHNLELKLHGAEFAPGIVRSQEEIAPRTL